MRAIAVAVALGDAEPAAVVVLDLTVEHFGSVASTLLSVSCHSDFESYCDSWDLHSFRQAGRIELAVVLLTVPIAVAAAVAVVLAGEPSTWCRSTERINCKFRKRLDRKEIGIENRITISRYILVPCYLRE